MTETDISVIFAIDAKVYPLYEKLAAFLPSAAVGTLTDSSTNIVNLLRENYDKIANRAELMLSYDTDALKVRLKYSHRNPCIPLPSFQPDFLLKHAI